MSEPKPTHTPGPWIVLHENDMSIITKSEFSQGEVVAQLSTWGDSELKANAQLIAAAPDLLAACKSLLSEPFGCPFCDSGRLRNSERIHTLDCAYVLLQNAIAKAEGTDNII